MSKVSQAMNKIRKKVREVVGKENVDESFFTFDRDSGRIVSNRKIMGHHFIFDQDGELIKYHYDPDK
jgi:hypothetical protein